MLCGDLLYFALLALLAWFALFGCSFCLICFGLVYLLLCFFYSLGLVTWLAFVCFGLLYLLDLLGFDYFTSLTNFA